MKKIIAVAAVLAVLAVAVSAALPGDSPQPAQARICKKIGGIKFCFSTSTKGGSSLITQTFNGSNLEIGKNLTGAVPTQTSELDFTGGGTVVTCTFAGGSTFDCVTN